MGTYFLKELVPTLSRGIRDIGKIVREEFVGIGDGNKTIFQLKRYPIKADSIEVFVDGMPNLVITINSEYGLITFNTAPAVGANITANYLYYSFSDGLLQDYLADSTIRLEIVKYQGYKVLRDTNDDAYLEAEPTDAYKMVIVLQAIIHFVEAGLVEDKLIVTRSWRNEELEESYARSVQIIRDYLNRLYAERDNYLKELSLSRVASSGTYIRTIFNEEESRNRYFDSMVYGAYIVVG